MIDWLLFISSISLTKSLLEVKALAIISFLAKSPSTVSNDLWALLILLMVRELLFAISVNDKPSRISWLILFFKSEIKLNNSTSSKFSDIFSLESSIEYVRNKWAEELTEVRRLERQERIQLVMVQDLEAKVKAVEIINNKYQDEIRLERAKQEQDALDEFVISRYR